MLKKMYDLQKKKGKKGFSMIELIIVIAIMAILVALIGTQLIPYLEKSREKRDMQTLDACLTNFQSAVAQCEATAGKGKTYTVNSDKKIIVEGTDITSAYEEFAGYKVDDLPKLFKSSGAKGKTVQWVTDANGAVSAECGDLKVSAKESGKTNNKDKDNP